jgi:hypothetical protein
MRYEVRKDQGSGWLVWDTARERMVYLSWSRWENETIKHAAILNRESARWLAERAADVAQSEQAEIRP